MATTFEVIFHVPAKSLGTVIEALDGSVNLQSVRVINEAAPMSPEAKKKVVVVNAPSSAKLQWTGKKVEALSATKALIWSVFWALSDGGKKPVVRADLNKAVAATKKMTHPSSISSTVSFLIQEDKLLKVVS